MGFRNLPRAIPVGWPSWLFLTLLLAAPPLLLAASAPTDPTLPGQSAARLQYNRDIRPILSENCFACHGFDKAARKGDLRLDVRADAVDSGAIVPGKPGESSLVERIFETKPARLMPPAKSHKKLTAAQKETLRRWVAEGAEYQPHWSFIPPTQPALPAAKNTAWARNPIDLFVLAGLEKQGLTPAPEADRRTLARRVSLDATGLPPSPADVEEFVADARPDAYERYVEKMLASPRWGEHRGRYWLDAARYADTHGIHFDNMREMWSYREWVVGAFNKNQPFDQFTVEQVAGDLLPNRTLEQQVASGFNRCNITTNEGGAINEEYLVLYTRDRTETFSQVFLGLTAGCAVCHDHKLDPISQREFYQMAAYFNNTTQNAMDGNIKDTPPVIFVPKMEDRPRWNTVVNILEEVRQQLAARKQAARPEFVKWLKTARPDQATTAISAENLQFQAKLGEGSGNKVTVSVGGKDREVKLRGKAAWEKGQLLPKALKFDRGVNLALPDVGDLDRTQPFTVSTWVNLPNANMTGALMGKMEEPPGHRGWDLWVENGRVGMHFINTWPTDAMKVVSQNALQPNRWHHVLVTHDGTGKAAGFTLYIDGTKQTNRQVQADTLKSTTRSKVPLKFAQRNSTSRLDGIALQDVRLYTRALGEPEARSLGGSETLIRDLLTRADKLKPAEQAQLYDWWLASQDATSKKLVALSENLAREESALRARGTIALVSQEKPSKAMARVLFRGDYDKPRDPVEPGTPNVLPGMPAKLPRNRLGLAYWLVQPGHPLLARVTVNRFWQEVFGAGIVRTTGDFGIAGELPSHPELLDWLALEFQGNGWDVKHMFRLMLNSAAYRQAALTTSEKRDKDPANALLSRGPRFRMDAEMIRDQALAASGLLSQTFGGASVRPYQPSGIWEAVAMPGSNTRDYRRDSGESLYRRSLYTFWKRAAPPASMDIFNAPAREFCVVRRERTNTPLQALVTLNDEQFVEAARVLAERALTEGGRSTDERVDFLTRSLMCRTLRPEERKIVASLLDDLLGHYRSAPAEAKKLLAVGDSVVPAGINASTLAGWTMLTNSLMNLDEVLNK